MLYSTKILVCVLPLTVMQCSEKPEEPQTTTTATTTMTTTTTTTLPNTWTVGTWGSCNGSCGTGTKTRTVDCLIAPCAGDKPSQTESCSLAACETTMTTTTTTTLPNTWTVGTWGSCNGSCGTGTKTRTVDCLIKPCAGDKPSQTESCFLAACEMCIRVSEKEACDKMNRLFKSCKDKDGHDGNCLVPDLTIDYTNCKINAHEKLKPTYQCDFVNCKAEPMDQQTHDKNCLDAISELFCQNYIDKQSASIHLMAVHEGVDKITKEQIREIVASKFKDFKENDKNGDAKWNRADFVDSCSSFPGFQQACTDAMVATWDEDENGTITFKEFVREELIIEGDCSASDFSA